jgi:hypothetical protein
MTKLFEEMEDRKESINDAIKRIIEEMFNEELTDDDVEQITSSLGLSDVIALDTAYTQGDEEKVRNIIGPLPQLEYSMGGRHARSAAAARPAPAAAAQAPAAAPQQGQAAPQGAANTSYSGDDAAADGLAPEDEEMIEGYTVLPNIDMDRYPEINGLEGPFRTRSGHVIYYDPIEGSYYDKDRDMYISNDEWQQMDAKSPDRNVIEMTEWLKKRAGIK